MALVSLSAVKVLRLNQFVRLYSVQRSLFTLFFVERQHIPTTTSKRILPEVVVFASAVYGIAEELKSPRWPFRDDTPAV